MPRWLEVRSSYHLVVYDTPHRAEVTLLVFSDDPHRVDYARDVAEYRQEDIDPEVLTHTLPKSQNPLS